MTIKEMESLAELDRATIRFYEKEGLFTPQRMSNGYRDYGEDDLDVLLRIKLLRSLELPLEDIKGIKAGRLDLQAALMAQIEQLRESERQIAYARELCKNIQADRATFETLNAQKYLDDIRHAEKSQGITYFEYKKEEIPYVFHPWRRYFARMLDFLVYETIWMCILVVGFRVNMALREDIWIFIDYIAVTLMMLFIEPLLLSRFGTTYGKSIFGIKIVNGNGQKLRYTWAFERTAQVFSKGMGYNIPLFNLKRMWDALDRARDKRIQPWDDYTGYTVKDTRWFRWPIYIAAYGLCFALMAGSVIFVEIPPNKGDLTVAEFAENFNYFADYYRLSFGGSRLDSRGKWTTPPTVNDGNIVRIGMDAFYRPMVFSYDTESDILKQVTVSTKEFENPDYVGTKGNEIVLITLAFAGTREDFGIFSQNRGDWLEYLQTAMTKSFTKDYGNVIFEQEIESDGYFEGDFGFIKNEGATGAFFNQSFCVRLER